jgi:hypothetical protein
MTGFNHMMSKGKRNLQVLDSILLEAIATGTEWLLLYKVQ